MTPQELFVQPDGDTEYEDTETLDFLAAHAEFEDEDFDDALEDEDDEGDFGYLAPLYVQDASHVGELSV